MVDPANQSARNLRHLEYNRHTTFTVVHLQEYSMRLHKILGERPVLSREGSVITLTVTKNNTTMKVGWRKVKNGPRLIPLGEKFTVDGSPRASPRTSHEFLKLFGLEGTPCGESDRISGGNHDTG